MDEIVPDGEADQEALLAFFYMCPVGILQIDDLGTVQLMNPMAAQLLMPVGRGNPITNLFDVLEACAPDLRSLVAGYAKRSGRICEGRRLLVGVRGGMAWVLACTLLRVSSNCVMAMLDEVSRQVAEEQRLRDADSWMLAVASNVADFAWFSLDSAGLIATWNESGVRHTGFAAAEVIGRPLDVVRVGSGLPTGHGPNQFDRARREGWHLHEGPCRTKSGREFRSQLLLTAQRQDDGTVSGFSVVLRDVSERKITTDALRRLVSTDPLTGAVNRARFKELVGTEAALWHRHARPTSAIRLDVDQFGRVQETFGPAGADVVLQMLVIRCQSLLRSTDVLARLAGASFAILLPGSDIHGAAALAERIRAATADDPFACDGALLQVTVSAGCASMHGGLPDGDALMAVSDDALVRAQQGGGNRTEQAQAGPVPQIAAANV